MADQMNTGSSDSDGSSTEIGPPYPEVEDFEIPADDEVISEHSLKQTCTLAGYTNGEEMRTKTVDKDGYTWRYFVYPCGQRNAPGYYSVFVELDIDDERFKYHGKPYNMFVHCKVEIVSSTNPKWNQGKVYRHLFKNGKGINWGFNKLIKLEDLTDPERGYLSGPNNDIVTMKSTIVITDGGDPDTWGDTSTYDSHKKTGMVGIQNQGMTCYMNSVLQTLYHTGALRMGVFNMPTEDEQNPDSSVALGIQRVFYRLMCHKEAVSTEELTKSFGWNAVDSFTQHDVQEFLRVLLDKMEQKMKGTDQEKLLFDLFQGKFKSYIKCTEVEYESSRSEPFLDLQLRVKGVKDMEASFEDYCEVELLNGDNKYHTDDFGMQDAKKGVIFEEFPPVLNIQLRRFEYDMMRDESYKVHDRFEYADKMNLDKFLAVRGSTPANFTLHSVLVQGGDITSGHYIVYTRPDPDGDWFKFDDENCVRVKAEEAIEGNFGQNPDETLGRRQKMSSAYMLVFVRDDKMSEILPKLNKTHIPQHLHARFEEEAEKAEQKRQEEQSAYSYMTLVLVQEEDLIEKHSQKLEFPQLIDPYKVPDSVIGTPIKVEKTATMKQLYEQVHAELVDAGTGKPIEALRLFPFENRENKTCRPGECWVPYSSASSDQKQIPSLMTNGKMYGKHKCILVAVRYVDEPVAQDERILVLCKYFDITANILQVIKFVYPKKMGKVEILHDEMVEALQLPAGTKLECTEELKPMKYTDVDLGSDFGDPGAQLQSGDILIWSTNNAQTQIALQTLCSEITVEFRELAKPEGEGFTIKMDNRMTYAQTVAELAAKLGMDDPSMLQLTQNEIARGTWGPGGPSDKVVSTTHIKLQYIAYIPYAKRTGAIPILFYEKIPMPIAEFESLAEFEVELLDTSKLMSVTKYKVHGPEDQNAADLIKQVLHAARSELSLMNCRLVQSYWNRLTEIDIPHDKKLTDLTSKFDTFRVEEIPDDERDPAMDGAATKRVQVCHVNKLVNRRHGTPFLFMLKDGETVGALRARLEAYLHEPKAVFAKFKLGYIVEFRTRMGTLDDMIEYFDDADGLINFADLKSEEPTFVLDHVDRTKKEVAWDNPGAIKIHN